jgi:hypothetical protein
MKWVVLLIVLLLACHAKAEEIQFSFSGYTMTPDYNTASLLSLSFQVDTLSPLNTFTYTTDGTYIDSMSCSVITSNVNITLDGQLIEQNGSGGFGFNGSLFGPPGTGEFIGGTFGASGGPNSFFGIPDFGLGDSRQSDVLVSTDPLGTILNWSTYVTDGITSFESGGKLAPAWVGGRATSVPEPSVFSLMALGIAMVVGLRNFKRCAT